MRSARNKVSLHTGTLLWISSQATNSANQNYKRARHVSLQPPLSTSKNKAKAHQKHRQGYHDQQEDHYAHCVPCEWVANRTIVAEEAPLEDRYHVQLDQGKEHANWKVE